MKAVSNPNPKAELHEAVEDYCIQIGEPIEEHYLHEEIDYPKKRTERFDLFIEYIEDIKL